LTEASCHASSGAVKLFFPALAALLLGCHPPKHWPPRPAGHPATLAELAAYELTVRGPPELARALSDLGFRVVDHPPHHLQLEVTLTREGDQLVATLRSDDWFVDEALGSSPEALARTLAVSARVAEFIRNSGLPQQHDFLTR
jgi:hypothetical protein